MVFFRKKRNMPDGLWVRCDGCSSMLFKKTVEDGMFVCPECNYHFRIFSRDRVKILVDENSFEEMWPNMVPCDPLNFKDRVTYPERVTEEQQKSGLKEAVIVGKAKINGSEVMIGITDPSFIMGSMGSVVGEKIARVTEKAMELRLPLILVSGSGGGARMQEGVFSLMQMAKTSAAIARFQGAGGLYISILTDPSLGGVMASFASLADITIAEPKALIGFAGPRVIQETIRRALPKGFQTAEFLLEHGFVDMIVNRQDMKKELSRLIAYLQ
ncbi:MAG: acetyl-CoA carboxylase carboxyltransferase subunit beta [Planctomycetia bacterium]|uniref:Acetyl-coenzyme A carboxylase carboxyl transferase subunit beta n=2 Tax=Candidatus Brocadia sapporoensis TaxID=392547 RepID=A0A1V6M1N9_9BACT|nr:acetyl-CoA carboxylase carboxyltransferase subunit beta [Candidatus Brocadia sapporoensis]OQZ04588.1 MAG: acetyl-CoA carboxylase carboxyl transferase subunit beta [Candidatus Brocadia sp. UTAMX1]QOJ07816.1 MAG: acetyl-CoA carboxylase carboxyltransferase subunit beta [Planctomycetia bacterium]QQR66469.1 MAG: acetyl-CoA carboxylase carboxyltransferase subunit beta [Candidatus Brocadia sp.]RZV58781.1 MAG: acetyl-CoA carboxylase carboxyltransferase subunit beta [Candidatus Brocadia sp. BROELEC01